MAKLLILAACVVVSVAFCASPVAAAACGVSDSSGFYNLAAIPTASLHLTEISNGLPGGKYRFEINPCRITSRAPPGHTPCEWYGNVNQFNSVASGGSCNRAFGASQSTPQWQWTPNRLAAAVILPQINQAAASATLLIECGGSGNALEASTFTATTTSSSTLTNLTFRFFSQAMCNPSTMTPAPFTNAPYTNAPYTNAPYTYSPYTPSPNAFTVAIEDRCFNASCHDCTRFKTQLGCQQLTSTSSVMRQCRADGTKLLFSRYLTSATCSGGIPNSQAEYSAGQCVTEVAGSFRFKGCL